MPFLIPLFFLAVAGGGAAWWLKRKDEPKASDAEAHGFGAFVKACTGQDCPALPLGNEATSSGAVVQAALVPALVALREQIDAAYPNRLTTSDGDVDTADETTEHGAGLALDITSDPTNGPNMEALAAALLRDPRVSNVIWNRQIGHDGQWEPYEDADVAPHTRHLHVAVGESSALDASPWSIPARVIPIASQPAKTPTVTTKAPLLYTVAGQKDHGLYTTTVHDEHLTEAKAHARVRELRRNGYKGVRMFPDVATQAKQLPAKSTTTTTPNATTTSTATTTPIGISLAKRFRVRAVDILDNVHLSERMTKAEATKMRGLILPKTVMLAGDKADWKKVEIIGV